MERFPKLHLPCSYSIDLVGKPTPNEEEVVAVIMYAHRVETGCAMVGYLSGSQPFSTGVIWPPREPWNF